MFKVEKYMAIKHHDGIYCNEVYCEGWKMTCSKLKKKERTRNKNCILLLEKSLIFFLKEQKW